MSITLGNYTKNTTAGSSITLTKPAGVTYGDLLLIVLTNDAPLTSLQWDNITNKPEGFELIDADGDSISDCHFGAFYRIADGTEATTIDCPANGSYDYCGFYINIKGVDSNDPFVAKGNANVSSFDSSTHSVSGVSGLSSDIVFLIGATDGADCMPASVSSGFTVGDSTGIGGLGGSGGFWSWNTGITAGVTATVTLSSNDGFSGIQFRFKESPFTIPTEIREKLHNNNGDPYANGTVVYCYDSVGTLLLTGAVGSIVGQNSTYPPGLASGEVSFCFDFGDVSQKYLVVNPSEDSFGLVTNLITPIQLT